MPVFERQKKYLHPDWVTNVKPAWSPSEIIRGKAERGRRRTARAIAAEDALDRRNTHATLSGFHEGLSTPVDAYQRLLDQQDISEPALRKAVVQAAKEVMTLQVANGHPPTRPNILIVNHGFRYQEIKLPVRFGKDANKVDLTGNPSLYDPALIEQCNQIFGPGHTFSVVEEHELGERPYENPKPRGYDVIVVLGDDGRRDQKHEESPLFMDTTQYAETLHDSLSTYGRIVISANRTPDNNLDALSEELLHIARSSDDFTLRRDLTTVFIDNHPSRAKIYIPSHRSNHRDNRFVWTIGRGEIPEETDDSDVVQPVSRKRGLRSWSRKRRYATGGAAVLAAGALAGGIITATSSPGPSTPNGPEYSTSQSATPKPLSCESGETPVGPSSINTSVPNQITVVFNPPNEPELDVTVDPNEELTVSQSPWGGTTPFHAQAGQTIKVPSGKLHIGKNNMLFCENPNAPAPATSTQDAPSVSPSDSLVPIPGATGTQ